MQSEGSVTGFVGIDFHEQDEVSQGVQAGVMSGTIRPVVQMPAYGLNNMAAAHEEVEQNRISQTKI